MCELRGAKTAIMLIHPTDRLFIGLNCLGTCAKQHRLLRVDDELLPGDIALQLAHIESNLI
jgi:hypothetical protein